MPADMSARPGDRRDAPAAPVDEVLGGDPAALDVVGVDVPDVAARPRTAAGRRRRAAAGSTAAPGRARRPRGARRRSRRRRDRCAGSGPRARCSPGRAMSEHELQVRVRRARRSGPLRVPAKNGSVRTRSSGSGTTRAIESRAPGDQRACGAVRGVPEVGHRGLDRRLRLGRHAQTAVDGARGGRPGDTGALGDLLERRRGGPRGVHVDRDVVDHRWSSLLWLPRQR